MTAMVAFSYYVLPNVRHKGRRIMPGAAVAVLACLGASLACRVYVAHFTAYARLYGAIGTVVLLLVWLYLWGIAFIVGGEINAILDRRRAHRATPAPQREPWLIAPRPQES
jgi:membrane protein